MTPEDRFTANGGAILIPPPRARCTAPGCGALPAALWREGWRCATHPGAGAPLLEVDAAPFSSDPSTEG